MSTATEPDEAASGLPSSVQGRESDRFLAENIPVQIWTALPNGYLDYVTEQTASGLGLTAAELLRDGWQTSCIRTISGWPLNAGRRP